MPTSSGQEALRTRVEQCYSALAQGDWRKVEKYLTKESKPPFRNQTKKPLLGYQIESIKIDPDGRTASVVVQVPVVSVATPRPILVSRPTLWRLINHTWYMELPRTDLPRADLGAQQSVPGMAPNAVKRPQTTPNVFSKDLKFESSWSGLGKMPSNETKVARFSFTNVSTRVVTLADMQLGCDCLRLKTQQMEYKPGESGTLEIEFDASKLGINRAESFEHDILFKTEPSGGYVKLTIGALLLPPGSPPPAKP